MKKLHLIFLTLVSFSLLSCEGPAGRDGYNGHDGKDGKDGTANFDVWFHEIKQSEWQLAGVQDAPGSYYYFEINDDALSEDISQKGTVLAYLEYEDANGASVYSPLPVVRSYVQTLKDSKGNDSIVPFIETYDFEHKAGKLTFAVTRSDYRTSYKPATQYYKIVYMY